VHVALLIDVLIWHKLKYNFVARIIKLILGTGLLQVFTVVKWAAFIKMVLEGRGLWWGTVVTCMSSEGSLL
jgi:hypothetical protein